MVGNGENVFKVFEFEFMPMGTHLEGGCINNMLRNNDDLNKDQDFPPLLKGPLGILAPPI